MHCRYISNRGKKETYLNPRHSISQESTCVLDMGNVICITQPTTTVPEEKLQNQTMRTNNRENYEYVP